MLKSNSIILLAEKEIFLYISSPDLSLQVLLVNFLVLFPLCIPEPDTKVKSETKQCSRRQFLVQTYVQPKCKEEN
jgi:hypothetical protein